MQELTKKESQRLTIANVELRHGSDGYWLQFTTKNGGGCGLHLENAFRGIIGQERILEWAREQTPIDESLILQYAPTTGALTDEKVIWEAVTRYCRVDQVNAITAYVLARRTAEPQPAAEPSPAPVNEEDKSTEPCPECGCTDKVQAGNSAIHECDRCYHTWVKAKGRKKPVSLDRGE
jgi:hypothetical protein